MEQIDSYLDELAARLRVGPARARRFLAEAEEHLRDSVARETAAGADGPDAERRAIERFGTTRQVARAANGPALARLGSLALAAAHLGVVGSAAVLAGTLLSRLVAAVTSTAATFGFPHDYVASAGQVAHWLAVQPAAGGDWPAAAASENAADTLVLRGGFAVLCLVVSLVAVRLLRRWTSPPAGGVVPAIGTTAFGGAAVFLLLAGLTDARTPFEWGRGLLLTDASVALVVAAAYAVVLVRRVHTA